MIRRFSTLLFCLVLLASGCTKEDDMPIDACENVVCLNGGACNNGSCDCPTGYSGPKCENFDPCFNIICLSGGVCVNGLCDCLTGYTGPVCGQQITPDKIKIKKVTVTEFPPTDNNGGGWDFASGPDLYFVFLKNDIAFYTFPTTQINADHTQDYTFTINTDLFFDNPKDKYQVWLYDDDSPLAPEFIRGIIFTPYTDLNRFPTTIELDAGENFACELELEYEF